jgi:hypothetical protein
VLHEVFVVVDLEAGLDKSPAISILPAVLITKILVLITPILVLRAAVVVDLSHGPDLSPAISIPPILQIPIAPDVEVNIGGSQFGSLHPKCTKVLSVEVHLDKFLACTHTRTHTHTITCSTPVESNGVLACLSACSVIRVGQN